MLAQNATSYHAVVVAKVLDKHSLAAERLGVERMDYIDFVLRVCHGGLADLREVPRPQQSAP